MRIHVDKLKEFQITVEGEGRGRYVVRATIQVLADRRLFKRLQKEATNGRSWRFVLVCKPLGLEFPEMSLTGFNGLTAGARTEGEFGEFTLEGPVS
jgi:hypothetical protein